MFATWDVMFRVSWMYARIMYGGVVDWKAPPQLPLRLAPGREASFQASTPCMKGAAKGARASFVVTLPRQFENATISQVKLYIKWRPAGSNRQPLACKGVSGLPSETPGSQSTVAFYENATALASSCKHTPYFARKTGTFEDRGVVRGSARENLRPHSDVA